MAKKFETPPLAAPALQRRRAPLAVHGKGAPLAKAVGGSPRVTAQRKLSEEVNSSPRSRSNAAQELVMLNAQQALEEEEEKK
ncbi:hypothetical protein [Massilia endophytica]|uniref:hypothetical protein n=1 Tax=Massilia endophytica TaxID=2899220 RepID=UPI001E433738|nr:hypothetical protein [Massilia endophytica]UGQ48186.1 hypothetical protein LSQ66_06895 [Massilia endophytica]